MSDALASGRARFERSLDELRRALESELGSAPRLGRWALVLGAAAAGFALGRALATRRRGRSAIRRAGA